MNKLKWLLPGMGIKRWIMLCVAGISLLALGAFLLGSFEMGTGNLFFPVLGVVILIRWCLFFNCRC